MERAREPNANEIFDLRVDGKRVHTQQDKKAYASYRLGSLDPAYKMEQSNFAHQPLSLTREAFLLPVLIARAIISTSFRPSILPVFDRHLFFPLETANAEGQLALARILRIDRPVGGSSCSLTGRRPHSADD